MARINFLKNGFASFCKAAMLMLIRFYQLVISPIIPANHCRFTPSCSQFMAEAIAKKGLLKGFYLGCSRLCRCHPFSKKSGFDPVE